MKEMMLKPRQRPKRPPREATKSTGPILMLRSNSLNTDMSNFILKYDVLLTHDGVLAKEDIDESNVFLPSIVKLTLDRVNDLPISLFLPLTLAQEGCPCASFSWRSARWRCRRGSNVLPSRMFRLPDIQQ